MKVWRIASEQYRNPVRKHTLVMKNVAGPHNPMDARSTMLRGNFAMVSAIAYCAAILTAYRLLPNEPT